MEPVQLLDQFQIDGDKSIYRYLSFIQLVSLIETRRLPLLNILQNWEDPNEGVITRMMADLLSQDPENEDAEEVQEFVTDYHRGMYGTCWSSLSGSDAMWRIYSPYKDGVRIKTSVFKLTESIESLNFDGNSAVGKVIYDIEKFQINDVMEEKSIFMHAYFLKNDAFSHEHEVRGVVNLSNKTSQLKSDKPVYLNISDDFIENVVIDPRARGWVVQTVKSYCESKGIKSCEKSKLYEEKKV